MEFNIHKNFSLDNSGWGEGQPNDIVKLLDSIITDFYSNLVTNKTPNNPVQILNSQTRNPPTNNPEIIIIKDLALLYLSTKDTLWSQYSYQFSHELCHYVINTKQPVKNDKFGWFEESLCELASFFTLTKMSNSWQTNPPYQNWKEYSSSLKDYVTSTISKPENNISKQFNLWFAENLPELYKDRYKRTENSIIAIHLLPFFTATPDLWKTIQYLNEVEIKDDMTFEQYLNEWRKLIPENSQSSFDGMTKLFIDN